MSTTPPLPRVLFLTPFHFADLSVNAGFDELVTQQLRATPGVQFTAAHVPVFNDAEETYDAEQERAVVTSVQQAAEDGYDAVIIACHYDPALQAARAASTIPVIGALQLTAGLAAQYGPAFHVITDVVEAEEFIGNLLEGYGLGNAHTGVSAIVLDGDTILNDTLAAATVVDNMVRDIAAQGTVQSVLIGCTIVSAAYEQHRDSFDDHGVRVINSNLLTVQGAAILAS